MSDVWNDAADATTGPQVYFGQLLAEAYYGYISFKKGESMVEFDPGQHNEANKYVVVKIGSITTLDDGRTFDINRKYICPKAGSNLGKEWERIVNPSLKKLGIHPRELADKWASWEMVETGRTWQKDGETVKGTAHKFVEFYTNEATCQAAEGKFYNRPAAEPEEAPPPFESNEDVDKARTDAALFLPTVWEVVAKKDPDAFYAEIAKAPLLSVHFDSNSPEVVAIVEGGAA